MHLQELIQAAWANRELLKETNYAEAVRDVIEEVDKGRLRTASPEGIAADGSIHWQVNEWVKQGILMYFAIRKSSATCDCKIWCLPRKKCSVDAILRKHWCFCR